MHHPDLFVVGDYLFDSTINGVLDSADVVAEWILEEIEDSPSSPRANGLTNGHGSGFPPIAIPERFDGLSTMDRVKS